MQCSDALKGGKWSADGIRVGVDPLPASLQGVFWLTGQGDAATLASFAESRDGCYLSRGQIEQDAYGYEYSIRVGGDRVWAWRHNGAAMHIRVDPEWTYHFDLTRGTASAPEKFSVAHSVGGHFTVVPGGIFTMELLSADESARMGYAGSYVWLRKNPGEIGSHYLVQVVDSAGRPLPAYKEWLQDCETQGASKGKFFYHEVRDAR